MTKKILAFLLAVFMLLTVAACGSTPAAEPADDAAPAAEEAPAEAPAEEKAASSFDGTLRVGISDALGNFLKGSAMGENYVSNFLVYDCIFYHDVDTKEVYSDILEDWYYEDDTTFVMKLKDGVTFSNGDPVTAEDILFSFTNYAERNAMTASIFATVDAAASYCEDDLTAVVKFTKPWGPGVYTVDPPLYNKSWCEEVGWDSEDWMYNPCGSGPYKVTEYVTDSQITLELRDDYWGDESTYNPDIKTIIVKYYPEIATLFIDLQTGALDLALNIAEADYARGMDGAIEGVTVDRVSTFEVEFLCMDHSNEYLANEDLRKAIAYGVDWSVVADAGFGTLCDPATSLINSNNPYYKEEPGFPYDPDLAQEYLEKSGYAGQPLEFHFVAMADADQQNMAEAFQFYMNQLGITINLDFFDFGTAIGTWLSGGTDFNFQESATGSSSAETYISLNALMQGYGAFPVTTVDDDEFNRLASAEMDTVVEDERMEYAHQLQDYNQEHCWVIPMLEGYYAYAFNNNVIESCSFDSAIAANLRNVTLVG